MRDVHNTLREMISRLASGELDETGVIPWASPIPYFGNPQSQIATLGLNPSPREFVDGSENQLRGDARRLHTLESLNLTSWSDAEDRHVKLILDDCGSYFSRNPYDGWFKKLDSAISGTGASYYNDSSGGACHLDLVPYTTWKTWSKLRDCQKLALLQASADTLGHLIRDSSIHVLILNGRSVCDEFQTIANCRLVQSPLPSSTNRTAYKGKIPILSGVSLEREIHVLGFSANIQRFVSRRDATAIKQWLTQTIADLNLHSATP